MVNINPTLVTAGALAGATGVALAKGKAIGAPGSPAHIITNKKVDNKLACIWDTQKEQVKDTVKLTAASATLGGAAAMAAGCSGKVLGFFESAKDAISGCLSRVSIETRSLDGENVVKVTKSLKDRIKDTGLYKKFNTLTPAAKVGIAVAAGALLVLTPLVSLISASKAGHIEGQYEKK